MRALAVLMVVAYHAGLPLAGGFTGPDVFFVVSGFVITGMLVREHRSTGRISIVRFYLRRARRLLPALAVLTLATLAMAAVLFTRVGPSQQVAARAARAVTTITANIYFLRESGGYFLPAAQDNPFLHTWSLSVEEQFYLAFPVALLALWALERRWRSQRRWTLAILALVCLGSLGANLLLSYGRVPTVWPRLATWIASYDPTRVAFFAPVTRAWEFLAGVLAALAAIEWEAGPTLRRAAAIGGIGLVVVGAVTTRSTDVFPGALVLMPVLGTVGLLIGGLGSPASPVTRLLSVKPLVWIGDRSYSWYLWHWPLIVYARAVFPTTSYAPLAAAAVSLVPAMLSFGFVEEPIRRRRVWPSPKAAVGIAAAGIAVPLACAMAFMTALDHGWGDPNLARLRERVAKDHIDITRACASMLPLGDPQRAPCVWTAEPSRGTILIIGDSNAGHFSEPFIAAANALHFDAQIATAGGCPFLKRLAYNTDACRTFVEGSLAAINRREPAYAAIVVSNASLGYLDGSNAPPFAADLAPGTPVTRPAEIAGWVSSLGRMLDALGSRSPIVVVGSVPGFYQFPQCLYPAWLVKPVAGCGVQTPKWAAAWRTDIVEAERPLVLASGAAYLDLGGTLCPPGKGCSGFLDGQPVYRDGGHLSVDGAMAFEPDFRRALHAIAHEEEQP
jgi:peptidoglycan/LPS O-acetylase OafA/YrhL